MHVLQNTVDQENDKKTVVIPFGMKYIPMKKLALVNFGKNPESGYIAFELQYFEDEHNGTGYRVIAYRTDKYVDVYDDKHLRPIADESLDVAGKGLGERLSTHIENTVCEKVNNRVNFSFEFIDKNGKKIVINISEQSTKKSNSINLLAPIGVSTENPSYLPLFFLYDFDFVRKHKTKVELTIDGKKIKQDPFPVPVAKDLQRRYFSRYSLDCFIIEFANTTNGPLHECTPNSSGIVVHDSLEYQFQQDMLKKIILKNSCHPLFVEFGIGFPDIRNLKDCSNFSDSFQIIADGDMGYVSGEYSVKRAGHAVTIELIPTNGWTPIPHSLLTKMMFSKKSIFRNWPKTYRYIQKINVHTLSSVSYWERIK